ncbi:DUF58 domain-containing protein [Rhodoflexus caldus]|uniref:DUF58 domain-containing protein n=1 Tax=Rhodoflexus caldus TaxID=2891236 RepID=UPI00202A47F6|nr:DUF58 domain-containing protein [Rhodoflexus caldus]
MENNLREIFFKLRRYEIKIRKAVNTQMQGDFHSVFKGSGLEFDDVRAYQYGDDVRTIDWNVSAKGHGIYVKTFKEEKEQNVFLILDVSGSQYIGKPNQQKIDYGREICGILTISALKENSSVGLLCFSNQREKYIKPKKGTKHAYELLTSMFRLQPESFKTSLNKALAVAMNIIKRKSIVVLVSDFVDEGYERNLKAMAKKHDLIVIHLADHRESTLPPMGIVPLLDKETRRTVWVNTSSEAFRDKIAGQFSQKREQLEKLCHQFNANYLFVDTSEDYVPRLVKLFKVRNLTTKK